MWRKSPSRIRITPACGIGLPHGGGGRWKEYLEQLKPLRKKPVLFIMMNSTEDADDVADWLAKAYPAEFGDGKTQSFTLTDQVR